MQWTVSYYDETLKTQILSMPQNFLATYLSITDILIEFGPSAAIPNVTQISEGIYKFYVSKDWLGVDFFYCTPRDGKIVILYKREYTDQVSFEQLEVIKKRQLEVTTNGKTYA